MKCENCGEYETRTDPLSYLSGFITAFVFMLMLEAVVKVFS